ncbi:MAG: OmpA family protein [Bacteroidota bacterium]
MNMKKKYLILLCCLTVPTFLLLAQPLRGSDYDTKIQLGKEALAASDYYNALTQFDEAFDEREDDALIPILAEINYRLGDYRAAESWYRRVLRRDKENKFAELRYPYAEVLKLQGKYADAMEQYQTYLDIGKDPTKKQLAQKALTGAEIAVSSSGGTQGVTLEALDRKKVNFRMADNSPALNKSGDLMYYTTNQNKEPIVVEDEDDPENFYRIFQTEISEDGYGKSEVLGPEINRPGYHSTNVSLSPEGDRMYFTRVLLSGDSLVESKIYMSEGGDGNWKSANEVVGVNGDFIAMHPIVGELYGKEVLFFTSTMEGGEGGRDLYYATYQGEGVYSDPVNLGDRINTIGDEETPFWFDGTLYFASDGYPTLGGLDNFYAVWNGTEWSEPTNMGSAYNSHANDHFFRVYDEGYQGYFASNRPEAKALTGRLCCDDIYTFTIARRYIDLAAGTFDEATKQALKGATVQLIDESAAPGTENTTSRTLKEGNRFDFPLDFDRSYKIIATHPDYETAEMTFNTVGKTETETIIQRLFLVPKPDIVIDLVKDVPIVMENILYDFDSDKITEQAEIDLNLIYNLMTEYSDMKVELGSHTDSRGNDDYNMNLSQRRAESARRWLMRKGIARARIVAQGYGETVPKVIDSVQNVKNPFLAVDDILTEEYIEALPEEEQREAAFQLNRRTEFKILEGPTSIQIKVGEQKIRPSEDRGSNIGQKTDPEVSSMSSLHGQKNLKGVPIMTFETRSHSLGEVAKGEKRSFTYTFTNEGDTDLIIDLVSACDCTSTNQDDLVGKRFQPGESGTLEVTFDSTEKDESETIDVDIYLRNDDNQGNPIVEMLKYDYLLK